MKRLLLPLAVVCLATVAAGEAKATHWPTKMPGWYMQYADAYYFRPAYQQLGPTYRFPPGYYAGMDFYYGYMGKPMVAPWWVSGAYELRYRSYRGNAADPPRVPHPADYFPGAEEMGESVPVPQVSEPPVPMTPDLPPMNEPPAPEIPEPEVPAPADPTDLPAPEAPAADAPAPADTPAPAPAAEPSASDNEE